jgi:hypothetical protein
MVTPTINDFMAKDIEMQKSLSTRVLSSLQADSPRGPQIWQAYKFFIEKN